MSCKYCGETFKKLSSLNNHINQHITRINFAEKYIKHSLDNIESINKVLKVVFVCWFGYDDSIPIMSSNRYLAFESIVNNVGVPVILITSKNYKSFIKQEHPIHEAFKYLSGVHKADYFRCYLLNHYGGGYHDIKHRLISWENSWDDEWTFDNNIWMHTIKEKNKGAVGYPPGLDNVSDYFDKLGTMGYTICKPNTPYTNNLLYGIELILNNKFSLLKKNPAKNHGGYQYFGDFIEEDMYPYPLRWLEILGEIFHPLMLKYTDHIKFGLPDTERKRYK